MDKLTRRSFLQTSIAVGGAALTGGLTAGSAAAAAFPSKAFTVYSAGKAGGGFGRFFLNIAPLLERKLGQPFKIVYVPGAGGVLCARKMLGSPADGHALGIFGIANMVTSVQFGKPEGITQESLAYVGSMYAGPVAFFTATNSKYKTIEQVVEDSKKMKIAAGVTNAREVYHIGGLMFNKATGAKIEYVPYGGGGPARKAAASGETPVTITGLFDASNMYNQLRCLCILWPENPIPHIIKAPTMKDVYGDKAVDVYHPVAMCISREVIKQNPDSYNKLVDAYRKVHISKENQERQMKSRFPKEALGYWSPEQIEDWKGKFIANVQQVKA